MNSSSLSRYIALLIRRGINDAKELASILNVSEDDVKEKLVEMERAKGLSSAVRKAYGDPGKRSVA